MKNVADIYPLTPTQAGILYHTLRSPRDQVYFQQISCRLVGDLDIGSFRRAWDEVVARHPALRTIFLWEGVDEPLQVVRQTVTVPWEILDWRGCSPEEQAGRLAALGQDYRARGFDLSKAPILRMALIRFADNQYQFVWNFHHLLTDGWSTHLVLYEALAIYEAMVRGEQYIPAAVRPFRNYIDWLKVQDQQAAERFWREQLTGFAAPTPLQVDKPVHGAAMEHGELSLAISAATSDALKNIARQHHLTLNTLIQGAWAILLSRYSGEEDVAFGTTLSGRPADLRGVERMVGMFINTLPLRVKVAEDAPLLSWLQQLQTQQLDIRQYEYSSLAKVQQWSEIEPGQQLFESIVVFENYPLDDANERSLSIENIHYHEQSNYPLALLVLPAECLQLLMIYDQARFDADTIGRMLAHLQTLLSAIAANPDQKLVDLPLIGPDEHHQIFVEWNHTETTPGPAVWVHEQVAVVARATPEKRAVAASDGSLTYGELDRLANQLAHRLLRAGITPGTPVGLFVERSTAMLVGILGILKAGCAYVPLDPTYPAQRIAFILNDTQAPLVVTQQHLASQLNLPEQALLILDPGGSQLAGEPHDAPPVVIDPASLAYIIYTSGSTGTPKGVPVTHSNLFHSTAARRHYYGEKVGRFLLLSSFAFDSSVAGIFWTLTDGGTLVLPAPGDERDLDQIARLIARQQVTHTLALPSLYRLLLDYAPPGSLDSLRTVIVAGEPCPPELFAQHSAQIAAAALYNEYGPTEATVWSSVYRVNSEAGQKAVPIGKPIANTKLYVLDCLSRPVPIGVPGELVIGGAGVVPGYWQRPDLSSERFRPNPFGEDHVYRTGDRVRWLPDGNLEFLGRVDNQVKIRGYRIELGEIENALRQTNAVNDALVEFKHARLIAYLIAERNDTSIQERTEAVRSNLAQRLPDYMLPSAWLWLDAFPRTPNGKIDRKSLPEPDAVEHDGPDEYAAPETDSEKKVQAIWVDLLGLKKISVQDDFFALGGHSLLMIQLVSRFRQAFNIPIPLSVVVNARTIAHQAERIDTLRWSAERAQSGSHEDRVGETREEFEI
jgi:surfactin family lipopeptide synthetase C